MIRAPLVALVLALFPTEVFREAVVSGNSSVPAEELSGVSPLYATAPPKDPGKPDYFVSVPLIDMTGEVVLEFVEAEWPADLDLDAQKARLAPGQSPPELPRDAVVLTALMLAEIGSNDNPVHQTGGGYGAVPEPSAWGLVIVGMGMVGAHLRYLRARRLISRSMAWRMKVRRSSSGSLAASMRASVPSASDARNFSGHSIFRPITHNPY